MHKVSRPIWLKLFFLPWEVRCQQSKKKICEAYLVVYSMMQKGRSTNMFSCLPWDVFTVLYLTVAMIPIRFEIIFVANNFLGFQLEGTMKSRTLFEHLSRHVCHISLTCHNSSNNSPKLTSPCIQDNNLHNKIRIVTYHSMRTYHLQLRTLPGGIHLSLAWDNQLHCQPLQSLFTLIAWHLTCTNGCSKWAS